MLFVFCDLKMRVLKKFCLKDAKIPPEDMIDQFVETKGGYKTPLLHYRKNGAMPSEKEFDDFVRRRLFPNKLFLAVHGIIVFLLIVLNLKFDIASKSMLFLFFSLILMLSRQFFSYTAFAHDSAMQKEASFQKLQIQPNFRLVGLQFTIIFGLFLIVYGAEQTAFAIIIVLWEFLTDVGIFFYQRKSRKIQ